MCSFQIGYIPPNYVKMFNIFYQKAKLGFPNMEHVSPNMDHWSILGDPHVPNTSDNDTKHSKGIDSGPLLNDYYRLSICNKIYHGWFNMQKYK